MSLNSHGMEDNGSTTFSRELKEVVWDLRDTKYVGQGRRLVLWTDFERVFQKLTETHVGTKHMLNRRVSRSLEWLLGILFQPN